MLDDSVDVLSRVQHPRYSYGCGAYLWRKGNYQSLGGNATSRDASDYIKKTAMRSRIVSVNQCVDSLPGVDESSHKTSLG